MQSEGHNKSRAISERTIGKNEGINHMVRKSTEVDRATSKEWQNKTTSHKKVLKK